jgi:hypothetical protein
VLEAQRAVRTRQMREAATRPGPAAAAAAAPSTLN